MDHPSQPAPGSPAARRSRLADLAAHAGVSEATVSRVLNERPGVSESTRQAVLTAVDVLGYDRPTRLRTTAVSLVGLVIPELTNPIFPAFAQAIEVSLAHRGFTPVLCTQSEGGVHEDEYVEMLLSRGVAGIIYVSGQHADAGTSPERYARLRERGLPIALVNGYMEGVDAPFVSDDDVAAMDLAVTHLAELGHERIGLALGQERFVPARRKVAGFRASMAALGLEVPDEHVVHTFFSVEGGAVAAAALVERGVTAIVCGSDLMALGAIRQIRTTGRSVPQDVSVVGYDDLPLSAFLLPPLTSVNLNFSTIGNELVRALLTQLRDGVGLSGHHVLVPTQLVVRSSTAPPSSS